MKILWLCNMMLPQIAMSISMPIASGGGWLVGLSNILIKEESIKLIVCFPLGKEKQILKGNVGSIFFYGFPQEISEPTKYNKKTEQYLKIIINEVNPDIIHIFGTEYPHTLAMVNISNSMNIKTIISIQGLVSKCAKHYMPNIPIKIQNRFTFRDFIRRDNLKQQQKKIFKRGLFEIEAIRKTEFLIGRTTWDKACTYQINQKAKYHFCNEILREEFYKQTWNIDNCEQNSIFVSQGSYPIKGLHYMLEAMPLIIKRFPNSKLYIAGNYITKLNTLKEKLSISSYSQYIKYLIETNGLHGNVAFTGLLDEKQMCERYLKSNVFVCPSSIENSPNSLGEAMILGVPCVASDVGGVPDMLKHIEEGFVYQADAPYMLAYYICEIFENAELALKLSKNSREHALKTHDREENIKTLHNIYKEIFNG